MIIRRLSTAYALLTLLAQDDAVARQWRPLLAEQGRFPTRRTWERRLTTLPPHLPGLIGCVGRPLVAMLTPWAASGRAVAVDSPPWKTRGGVWHNKHQEAGEMPQTSLDPEAGWSQSGWQGWWYGWKLHLAVAGGAV
jgi:hypothetical protein